jgi:hypothetical protein
MRIALCNEVIAAMPFERQCAFARSVGYDAIEIAPFTLTDDPARLPAARAANGVAPRPIPGSPSPACTTCARTSRAVDYHLRCRPAPPHGRRHARAVRAGRRSRRPRPGSWLAPSTHARRPAKRTRDASAPSIALPRLPKRRRRRASSIASNRCRATKPSSSTPWRRLPRSCAPSTTQLCAP